MPDRLFSHINKFIHLTTEEYNTILPGFQRLSVKKKHTLLSEGQVCRQHYFVSKGCLRLFFINEKGIEQTVAFALENWWLADYTSFAARKPASFSIQAVEASELLAIGADAQEAMLRQMPKLERYFRLIHERAHAAAQFRVKAHSVSREAVYLMFRDRYPDFVQRVPQYLLASFLGLTPEYLSEIRRKLNS